MWMGKVMMYDTLYFLIAYNECYEMHTIESLQCLGWPKKLPGLLIFRRLPLGQIVGQPKDRKLFNLSSCRLTTSFSSVPCRWKDINIDQRPLVEDRVTSDEQTVVE
jgi:hypothetical protein